MYYTVTEIVAQMLEDLAIRYSTHFIERRKDHWRLRFVNITSQTDLNVKLRLLRNLLNQRLGDPFMSIETRTTFLDREENYESLIVKVKFQTISSENKDD